MKNQNQIENMDSEKVNYAFESKGLTKSDLKEVFKNRPGNTMIYFGDKKIISAKIVGNKITLGSE